MRLKDWQKDPEEEEEEEEEDPTFEDDGEE